MSLFNDVQNDRIQLNQMAEDYCVAYITETANLYVHMIREDISNHILKKEHKLSSEGVVQIDDYIN